jgi:hypothetical protein
MAGGFREEVTGLFPSLEKEGWLVEHLRFTLLPAEPRDCPLDDLTRWWSRVTGNGSPTARGEVLLPNASISKHVEGPFGEEGKSKCQLFGYFSPISQGIERFDLYVVPSAPPPPNEPLLGPFSLVSDFVGLVERFLDSAPPAKRLAFGSVFVRKGESREGALSILQEKLPTVRIDVQNTHDFVYLVNKPVFVDLSSGQVRLREGEGHVRINRIGEWRLTLWENLIVGEGGTFTVSNPFARVMLDINTHLTYRGVFSEGEFFTIAGVLLAEGMNLLLKGDHLPEEGEG